MEQTSTWSGVFIESLQSLWFGVVDTVPKIVVALLLFFIGWLVAGVVYQAVVQAIKAIKLDSLLSHTGLDEAVRKAGYKLNSGVFLGTIFKWFIIIVFLQFSLSIVGLTAVDDFLNQVIGYLPSVVVAVIVLIAGSLIADVVAKAAEGSAKAANVIGSSVIGTITKTVVWVFAILIALSELNIGQQIINPLIIGIIAMFALAGGLAFGLGGRDAAAKLIDRMKTKHKDAIK